MRTIVLIDVLRIRVLAVPEVKPLGGRYRDLQVLVFLRDEAMRLREWERRYTDALRGP